MDPKEMKERMKIPKQPMPEQNPKERVRNFYEVPYGYTSEQAMQEAKRCIMCKNPLCVGGCPVNIDIPWFIQLIAEGKFVEAARKIKETNGLPAVCGRVCPQEDQCEKICVVGKKGQPVSIGRLERFAADYEREHGEVAIPDIPKWTGKKVALVGAGPAGLTVAGDLVKKGHKVTVFEALHAPGGVEAVHHRHDQVCQHQSQIRAGADDLLGFDPRSGPLHGMALLSQQLRQRGGHLSIIIHDENHRRSA